MDVKKSKLNVGVSLVFKLVTMVVSLVTRRVLISVCGNDINGLNALFLSIIGFLSVVELGVGSAITFCMYKPIVDGDLPKVGALYNLFRKAYLAIGLIIFVGGLGIMPFLKFLAKDYNELDTNLYFTFFLVLVSVTITYLFSAKTSLINAYKNNYISTIISQGGLLFQHALQIVVLLITRSFVCYLLCRIAAVLVQYVCTELVARKKYPDVLRQKGNVDPETGKQLKKSISAMFMHKIGSILVNTVDSVVISAFIGVAALGEYSNYTVIQSAIMGIITMIFTSLTSVVGHLYVEENQDISRRYCECFHLVNYIIATVIFLGYYAIIDNIVALLFAPDLVAVKSISFVITVNGFVQYMRQTVLVFKDATGTFYNDRWKPLVEGVINIVFSILFVHWIGVVGVIVATIMTNLLICHIVEPFVLYKNAFFKSPKRYYLRNYTMIVGFMASLGLLHYCMCDLDNIWLELLANGFMSVGFSLVVIGVVVWINRNDFRFLRDAMKKR